MQIRSIANFVQRISYQSTCVKVRTTSASAVVVPVSQETTGDYYSEEFSIRRTSNLTSGSDSDGSTLKYYPSPSSSSSSNYPRRMPIVAAVVAHRRFYPAATTYPASSAGSQRSSCAVRLSALNILAPPMPNAKAQSQSVSSVGVGGRKASTKFPQSGVPSFTGDTVVVKGGCRPLLDLKQLGGGTYLHLKNNGKGTVLAEARRYYAKGRDKLKNRKTQVLVNEAEMAAVVDVEKLKAQLGKVIEEMKDDYTKQLNIRGAAGALESLEVEFDGEVYPLQELAQVGRKNPQLAVLNLASLPDAIKPVMQAIQDSGMNLNPQQEGTTIYVPLPKVTREHRENLAKNAKALFTKYKVALQGVQNKFVKQAKSQAGLSEDLVFSVNQQIMKLTDNYIAEAENLMHLKQKELLEK